MVRNPEALLAGKWAFGLASAALASLALYGWMGLGPGLEALAKGLALESPFSAYVIVSTALFALYGLALALIWRKKDSSKLLAFILVSSVAFRASLIPSPPVLSSDIYRYIWDGRVQARGIAPWSYPPQDPALAELRDETIWPHINRKEARTIYPPGAQALFRLNYALVGNSLRGTKAFMVLADLATIGLLVVLLGQMGLPRHRVSIYAWNPLVIFEVAMSGHLEPLYLPALVGAFLAFRAGRRKLLGVLLGAATLIKLYPALLVAAFHRKGDRQMPLAWAVSVGLGYLPFLGLGRKVLGFLPIYLLDPYEEFNQGVRFFARALFGSSPNFTLVYLGLSALGLAALLVWAARSERKDPSAVATLGLILGGFYLLVLTPALHPWYLLWLLLLATISPSATVLAGSWAVGLSYLKYAQDPQILPLAARVAEFLPVGVLLCWELLRNRARSLRQRASAAWLAADYGETRPL